VAAFPEWNKLAVAPSYALPRRIVGVGVRGIVPTESGGRCPNQMVKSGGLLRRSLVCGAFCGAR
jgi:hypothetical protein